MLISRVNTKSEFKPFYIYEPGTRVIPYGGGLVELRAAYSRFPTWNHWPVAQVLSDGRYALAPDRVSSSAITSPEPPMTRRAKDGALNGRFIMGLSNKPMDELVSVARSWLRPAELRPKNMGFKSQGYSRNQRAYILRKEVGAPSTLEFKLTASRKSPIVNPVFVVNNWGVAEAELELDGNMIKPGKTYRFDLRHRLEGIDLVVWIGGQWTKPVSISLSPAAD